MPGRQAQQDLRYMFDSFGKLSEAIQKQREEKLYNDMLNELDPPRAGTADGRIRGEKPHRGGKTQYKLLLDREERDLDRRLKEALIKQRLRGPRDGMTDYQALQLEMARDREERASERWEQEQNRSVNPPNPVIRGKLMWNGSSWVKAPDAAEATADPIEEIDKQIAATKVEIGKGNKRPYLDEPLFGYIGKPAQQTYSEKLAELQANRSKLAPKGSEPNADPYAQQVRPSVTPTPKPASTGSSPVVTEGEPPVVRSKAQWDALPPGTKYLAPDGTIRIKQ